MSTHMSRVLLAALVAAGLGTATSNAAESKNLFPNGAFDRAGPGGMPDGWKDLSRPQPSGKASAAMDRSVGHLAGGALKLSLTGPAGVTAVGPKVPVQPGKDYLLVTWYRAEGFGPTSGFEGVNSQWNVQWLDRKGKAVGRNGSGFPYSKMDWTLGTRLVSPPPGTVAMQMTVTAGARKGAMPSSLWIDDVRLVEVPPNPNRERRRWTYNVVRLRKHPFAQVRRVADDDAAEGRAAIATVGHTPKKTYLTAGYYTTEPQPGIYRVLFRLKVADNTGDAVVARVDVGCAGAAWGGLAARPLKASDFAQPMRYQDFTLRIVRAPGTPGKRNWLDFRAYWTGTVTMWADSVSLVQETAFSPAEQQKLFAMKAAPPAVKEEPISPFYSGKVPTPGPLKNFLSPPGQWATKPVDEPARPEKVTRGSYLKTIQKLFKKKYENVKYWTGRPEPYPNIGVYLDSMKWLAFAYHVSKKEEIARYAVKALEHAHILLQNPKADGYHRPGKHDIKYVYRFNQWIGDFEGYTPKHKKMMRDLALNAFSKYPADRVEYGAMNRPFGMAANAEMALKLVPDLPDKAAWRKYIDTIWNEWWPHRDTVESTGNYEALSFRYFVDWVDAMDAKEKIYGDKALRRYFERFLLHVFPLGSLPHYGDTNGWNVEWGHWIMLLEIAARHTKDGRYKWAAHRLYEYAVSRIEKLDSWGYTGSHCGESLMIAYLMADDSIAEVAPASRVRAVTRPTVQIQSKADIKKTRRACRILDKPMPDKLVMVGSPKRTSTALMIDACPAMGHNPGTATALVALVDGGSVLLTDSGYIDRLRTHHNLVFIEDYDGVELLNPGRHLVGAGNLPLWATEEIRYGKTAELAGALYASVSVTDYQNYNCRVQRDVLVADRIAVLVRDTVTFKQDLKARIGPVYNVGRLGPEAGEHWFHSSLGLTAKVRGIYPNQPILTKWSNPARDLLVAFQPVEGAKLEALHRGAYDSTHPLPYRVQYVWRGNLKTGQQLQFATLLWPNDPTPRPGKLAEQVQFQSLPGGGVSVAVPSGRETVTFLINPAGNLVKVGPVDTDARFGVIRATGALVRSASLGDVSQVRGPGLKKLQATSRQEAFEHGKP